MKIIIQRVNNASVYVDNKLINAIEKGYLILLGICNEDNHDTIDKAVKKIINLRIFEDENNKMNHNIKKIGGEILLVSQFTLCSSLKNGNRPSFDNAMNPEKAEKYFNVFFEKLNSEIKTLKGIFGAYMQIKLENDGPATFILEL